MESLQGFGYNFDAKRIIPPLLKSMPIILCDRIIVMARCFSIARRQRARRSRSCENAKLARVIVVGRRPVRLFAAGFALGA